MTTDDTQRQVTLTLLGPERMRATNSRGGTLDLGSAHDEAFSPVELLLVAIGGCTGLDVAAITGKRATPDAFTVEVTATKVRNGQGNHLEDIRVNFAIDFPAGPAGDAAREVLPLAVQRSHDRLCTVSRTVELPTPVTPQIVASEG